MSSTVKAVFFDIGGTLRVSRKGEKRDYSKVRQMMTLLGEKEPLEVFVEKIHRGEKRYRRWCKPNFIELGETELLTRFLLADYPVDFVRENAITLNQLWRDSRIKHILPDAVSTLEELAGRGYKIGLISNTTSSVEAYQMLEEMGVRHLVSAVVLSAAFGRRKPYPSLFLEAARQAKVHPIECAYVGDRPSRDLLGAIRAGYCTTVIISNKGYALDEVDQDEGEPEKDAGLILKPDHKITNLSQLLEIFPKVTLAESQRNNDIPEYLYDVSLSTMWGVDQPSPFDQTFLAAKGIGISSFELNHKVTSAVFERFDYNRHHVGSVHDPCRAEVTFDEQKRLDFLISSLDEEKRKKAVEIACKSIDLAYQLGAKSVVIHPGSIQCDRSLEEQLRGLFKQGKKDSKEYEQVKSKLVSHRASLVRAHLEQVIKSLVEIAEYNSNRKGVALALENRYRYYDLPLPDELDRMLAVMGGNAFGFQYDLGHATVLDALDLVPHLDWLERFGTRIVGTHLHDVRGLTDHLAPGLGQVNYGKISPYLPDNCIKTMEVSPEASLDQIASGLEVLTTAGIIKKL